MMAARPSTAKAAACSSRAAAPLRGVHRQFPQRAHQGRAQARTPIRGQHQGALLGDGVEDLHVGVVQAQAPGVGGPGRQAPRTGIEHEGDGLRAAGAGGEAALVARRVDDQVDPLTRCARAAKERRGEKLLQPIQMRDGVGLDPNVEPGIAEGPLWHSRQSPPAVAGPAMR
jgi:hypothetical protein